MPHLVFQSDDITRLEQIFTRRAQDMVPQAMDEGRNRANDYAAAGGRHRTRPGRYQRRAGARFRQRRATGSQIVSMQEKVLYRRFIDFFGEW